MASRRVASVITFSAGANTNSASWSTNFLISHGQATRSTLTFSRVIHFMLNLHLQRLYPRGHQVSERTRIPPCAGEITYNWSGETITVVWASALVMVRTAV